MGTRWSGAIVAGVVCAVLAGACTNESAGEDDAEVLGIQVERDGTEVATVSPAEPTTDPTSSTDAPDDAPSPTAEPAPTAAGPGAPPTDDAAAPPASSGTDEPQATTAPVAPPPAPSPAPSPSPSPEASPTPAPSVLTTRTGHSYLTWFRDEEPDGQGGSRYVWGEVSAAPTVSRDGSEPLRVTLVDLAAEPDRTAPRRAQCRSWLEVDGDRPVHARGEVTVDVVVDGEVVSSGTRSVDATVPPGERRDLVAIGDVRVAVPDVGEVTCRVTFAEGGTG